MNRDLIIGPLIILLSLYLLFEDRISVSIDNLFSNNSDKDTYLITDINRNAFLYGKSAIEISTESKAVFYIFTSDMLTKISSNDTSYLRPNVKCKIVYQKDKKAKLYNIVESIAFINESTEINNYKKETENLAGLNWAALFLTFGGLFVFYKGLSVEMGDSKRIRELELINPTKYNINDFPLRINEFVISKLKTKFVVDRKVNFELESVFNISKDFFVRNYMLRKASTRLSNIEFFVLKLYYLENKDKYGYLHPGTFVAKFYIKHRLKAGLTMIFKDTGTDLEKGDYSLIKNRSHDLINAISFLSCKNFKVLEKVDENNVYSETREK